MSSAAAATRRPSAAEKRWYSSGAGNGGLADGNGRCRRSGWKIFCPDCWFPAARPPPDIKSEQSRPKISPGTPRSSDRSPKNPIKTPIDGETRGPNPRFGSESAWDPRRSSDRGRGSRGAGAAARGSAAEARVSIRDLGILGEEEEEEEEREAKRSGEVKKAERAENEGREGNYSSDFG